MNKVAGIVVTYNPDANFFIQQVLNLKSQVEQLYIIDNGSSNTDFIDSAKDISGVTCQLLNENKGLATAQNIAISLVKGSEQGFTHIILFDQDSLISDGFIASELQSEKMLLAKGLKVAAIGPVFYDGITDYIYPATVYKGPFIKRVELTDQPISATFVIASGSLIRISVLDEVGLMKDELFIDYIDVEWGLRAASYGYISYMTPLAKMKHTIGDDRVKLFGKLLSIHSDMRKYYLARNSFYMLRLKYVPFGYKLRECVFNIVRISVGVYFSKNKKKCIKMVSQGVWDGIRNKFSSYYEHHK